MKVDFKFVPSFKFKNDKISKRSIFFMHIPKCGGTTIDNIFAKLSIILKNFNFKRFKYDKSKNKIKLLESDINKRHFISGHLDYNFVENIDSIFKCTVVREPSARVLSHYRFMLYKLKKTNEEYPFEMFIEDEIGSNRDNLITRHFSGFLDLKKPITEQEKNKALINIEFFDHINSFDNWDNFLSYILSYFGLPSILYSKYQQHDYTFFYSPDKNDYDLIKKYYKYDYEIFSNIIKKNKFFDTKNNKEYDKDICIVSPYFNKELKLYSEKEVKELFLKNK